MKFTGLWEAGQAPQLWFQPYEQAIPWTAVHTRGFAQQGNLCSQHSKIWYSMFSNTTTRAKVQEPAVPGSRALINIPLFSLETSLPFLLLSCEIGWRQEEKQDMMSLLAVFCTLHCCPEWIKHRKSNLSPLQRRCTIQIRCERSPQKAFTSPGEVTEETWDPHPTPLLLFDFHHDCNAVACPFTSICCGLIWAYLGIWEVSIC